MAGPSKPLISAKMSDAPCTNSLNSFLFAGPTGDSIFLAMAMVEPYDLNHHANISKCSPPLQIGPMS